ncbi:MAG: VTT domain-containing protein [Chloroflexi bacterium]|uniref:VTT domain-containing protein n=1 Tax=Candidatus Chlorohelix allophototropha TaxID=3003348 RepID=A0A8T7LVR3_9CHLR|nr:VTT domain-containing protein [Chloroflexota bacterium]
MAATDVVAKEGGFFLDPVYLIKTLGLFGIVLIVFAESGLLFGFFFPGDSLLFTAGFFASQGWFDIWLLVPLCFIAAVLGDSVGYWTGSKFGPKLFNKEDSFFFHKDHIIRAQKFYDKYGGKTVLLARFVPIVRTFAPIVAGMGKMRYATFLAYNVVGAFVFAVCITLAGYFLGQVIPDIDKFLLPIIFLIILVSVAPGIYHIFKEKDNRMRFTNSLKKLLKRDGKVESAAQLNKKD